MRKSKARKAPCSQNAIVAPTGRLAQLMKPNPSDQKLIEEIFLSVVSRLPTTKEMTNAQNHLQKSATRMEGAQDLMWALINSPAFLFNR